MVVKALRVVAEVMGLMALLDLIRSREWESTDLVVAEQVVLLVLLKVEVRVAATVELVLVQEQQEPQTLVVVAVVVAHKVVQHQVPLVVQVMHELRIGVNHG
jgi:hypothetical protein